MTSIAGLCSLLSLISIQGFRDARVCSDDRVTSNQIVLDTFDSETTGKTTCLCQVYKEGAANNFQFLNIQGFGNGSTPNVSECGSTVRLRSNNNEHIINCSTFPSILTYVAPMDVIWTALYAGDSKYCLEITTTVPSDAIITVSCSTDGITTTASPPQCVTHPESTRELDDLISTTPTDVQGQCVSVESVVLTIVFGYLLAALVTVTTVMYFRRKTIRLENKMKKNVDECRDTVSTVLTDITSIAPRAAAPTPVSEPLTTTIPLYDEPDSSRYDGHDSKRYDDLVSKRYDDLVSKRYDDLVSKRYDDPDSRRYDYPDPTRFNVPDSELHADVDPTRFDKPDSERRDNAESTIHEDIDPIKIDDPDYLHVL
ncbi:uncharacterized protein LOC110440297 isoform X2 [Mizuhopecten yessoensis]|uniref:uncharacterized protein LOC110440297 isoform X2 n=1 Tax=Mizuhopecten yessoensis TaxID=6573 RepID=UPI000B45CD88|nr:uncharacterized protein LOC110440297 isoform X2 [Mizuhopecten yessoensis]